MKKTSIIPLFVLGLLTGCGSQNEQVVKSPEEEKEEEVNVVNSGYIHIPRVHNPEATPSSLVIPINRTQESKIGITPKSSTPISVKPPVQTSPSIRSGFGGTGRAVFA